MLVVLPVFRKVSRGVVSDQPEIYDIALQASDVQLVSGDLGNEITRIIAGFRDVEYIVNLPFAKVVSMIADAKETK